MANALDAAVAEEVMGWTRTEAHGRVWWSTNGNWTSKDYLVSEWQPTDNGQQVMEILQKLQPKATYVSHSDGSWYVVLILPSQVTGHSGEGPLHEAFCRAALKSVLYGTDKLYAL